MASGQSAASNQGAAAGQYGANAGNMITAAGNAMAGGITGAGNAQAAGYMGMANTLAGGINTAASGYQNQQNFNNWMSRQPNYGNVGGGVQNAQPYTPGLKAADF